MGFRAAWGSLSLSARRSYFDFKTLMAFDASDVRIYSSVVKANRFPLATIKSLFFLNQ